MIQYLIFFFVCACALEMDAEWTYGCVDKPGVSTEYAQRLTVIEKQAIFNAYDLNEMICIQISVITPTREMPIPATVRIYQDILIGVESPPAVAQMPPHRVNIANTSSCNGWDVICTPASALIRESTKRDVELWIAVELSNCSIAYNEGMNQSN